MHTPANRSPQRLRAGMVGLGMIFEETYRPLFEQLHAAGLYRREFGLVEVELAAVASRTGTRAERYRQAAAGRVGDFASFAVAEALPRLLAHGVDAACITTPDDRLTEAMDRVVDAVGGEIDKFSQRASRRVLEQIEW